MKKLTNQELKNIKAGTSITGSLLNYLNDLINILVDAGRSLGTAIRRIGSDSICPLD
ncbi:MAG TPA: hypothetical protein IAB45_06585 [Candidatus Onthousia faecavium]|nr:hypothetical protein [Candidatus Onthousia faecavium]